MVKVVYLSVVSRLACSAGEKRKRNSSHALGTFLLSMSPKRQQKKQTQLQTFSQQFPLPSL